MLDEESLDENVYFNAAQGAYLDYYTHGACHAISIESGVPFGHCRLCAYLDIIFNDYNTHGYYLADRDAEGGNTLMRQLALLFMYEITKEDNRVRK